MFHPCSCCVLNAQPLTWFECSLWNKGFKSVDWGNDNILLYLWIFHFIPTQSKCTMWVKSQSSQFWTEGREHIFSTSICNSTTALSGIFRGFHSPSSGIFQSIRGMEHPTEELCLEFQPFLETLELLGFFLSLIRGYSNMRHLLLCFDLSRVNSPWHSV